MKTLLKSALAVSFSLTMLCAIPQIKAASSQQDDTTAKEDLKDAGHSTKRAAKKTGSAAKRAPRRPRIKPPGRRDRALRRSRIRLNRNEIWVPGGGIT